MLERGGKPEDKIWQHGFSLLELMVVMVILSILVAVSGPALSSWRRDNELKTSALELSSVFRYARTEALARNAVVTVATLSGGDDWSGDVQVYVDVAPAGGNTAFNASTDTLLKNITTGGSSKVEVSSNTSAEDFVSFGAAGALNEGGNVSLFGICDDRGTASGYSVSINSVGRVSSAKLNGAGDCTP